MIPGNCIAKAFTSQINNNNHQKLTPSKITRKRLPKPLQLVLALQAVGLAALTAFTGAKAEQAKRETAYRASILHFLSDPATTKDKSYEYIKDGLLIVRDGQIVSAGPYKSSIAKLAKTSNVVNYSGYLITPGFVDAHVHYPQVEIIASYGEQLIEWLNTYVFPAERKYSNSQYAREKAEFFLSQLIKNGTTTALVFATVDPTSVNAFFEAALAKNMRMIAGKVLMDRNAPAYLLDTPESGYQESLNLIKKWHGVGRLSYAITPRFAPTSSPAQLQAAGRLKAEFPSAYVHTHLSENKNEIAWVKSLFPERKGYLDVYHHYGLTGPRSIFAHAVHLDPKDEVNTIIKTKSVLAFCPTSNLFLGSGLFPFRTLRDAGARIALGTDVGAGTSLSILATLNEGYKVAQLQQQKLSPLEGFYLATLGGAQSLSLADRIGNFLPGKEADFIVLDPKATAISKLRLDKSQTLEEMLFALMILGDDRNIKATYVAGVKQHEQP